MQKEITVRTAGIAAAALLAAVAMSAIAASSASADEWFIEGTKLAAGKSAALATAAPVDELIAFKMLAGSSSEVEIRCEGANLIKAEAYISGGTGGMAKAVTFEACEITKPSTDCALEGQPRNISTTALGITTLLAGPATKIKVNVHPLSGTQFTTIPIASGSTCLDGEGEKPIKGSVFVLSSNTGTESVTHTVMAQGSLENNSLEVAGQKAIVSTGLVLDKLASGSKWSFHA
jgi:hypothetical protein